jgi:DinB family protein
MFERSIQTIFTPEEMKQRIDDRGNSIAWLIWHTARTEDMVVQALIKGDPQILFSGDWQQRLGVDASHIGTGIGEDEIGDFMKSMNVEAVDDYWKTVAKTSFEWLKSTSPEELDEIIDVEKRLESVPDVVVGGNNALTQFWNNRNAAFLFQGPVISHGYIHVGQMQEIGGRLGRTGWA